MNPGVITVLEVLKAAGFRRLDDPLVVDGTVFEFEAAVAGTGVSHDLVLICSTQSRPERLIRLLSALCRTLDHLRSRRPVSLVLIDEDIEYSVIRELERYARVLPIDSVDPSSADVERALAVLFRLSLARSIATSIDPLDELAEALDDAITNEHRAFIDIAPSGSDGVREELRRYIDSVVDLDDE